MTFRHRTFQRFWNRYEVLPVQVQRSADKQYLLLCEDPSHRSLGLKEVGPYWSARVTSGYRALAIRHGDVFHWFSIGPHDEYERILRDGA